MLALNSPPLRAYETGVSDGSCLFAAVVFAVCSHLRRSRKSLVRAAQDLRAAAVAWQQRNRSLFGQFFSDAEHDAWLTDMAKPNTWGDHTAINAIANAQGVRIIVHLYTGGDPLVVEPIRPYARTIHVLWLGIHYVPLLRTSNKVH